MISMSRTEQTNENEILSVMIEGKIDEVRVFFSKKTKNEKGVYNVKNKRH